MGPKRAEGVEAFAARPLAVEVLQVARGYVVHNGVAEDVLPGAFAVLHLVAAPADQDSEFALVIDTFLLRVGRTIAPPGASRAEGGLLKMSGSVGISCASSRT